MHPKPTCRISLHWGDERLLNETKRLVPILAGGIVSDEEADNNATAEDSTSCQRLCFHGYENPLN